VKSTEGAENVGMRIQRPAVWTGREEGSLACKVHGFGMTVLVFGLVGAGDD